MKEFPQIPGYRIIKKLGQGGMADVYLGVQEKLDRQVAIKVLIPHLFRDEQFSTRFIKEAQTAARLVHPNIITIHDVGEIRTGSESSLFYIVMEYLAESLSARIKRRGLLPAPETFGIVKMIASALDYAHQQGFIHRDIKPDNIMFRSDGTVVLVDFGIARAIDSTTHLTRTGMSIGTPHYMSPEQCLGDKIDGRSDIYALGVELFELLTGDVPYRAENTAGVIIKHIQDPIPLLPAPLNRYQPLIDSLMAKKKELRPKDGREVIQLIETYAGNTVLATIDKPRPISRPVNSYPAPTREDITKKTPLPYTAATASALPKPKKGPLVATLLILVSVLALAGLFILLGPGSNDTPTPQDVTLDSTATDSTPNQTGKTTDPDSPGNDNSQNPGNNLTNPSDPNTTINKNIISIPPISDTNKNDSPEPVDKEQFRRDIEYETYMNQARKDIESRDYERAWQSLNEAAKRKKTTQLSELQDKVRHALAEKNPQPQGEKTQQEKITNPIKSNHHTQTPPKDSISLLELQPDLRIIYTATLNRLTIPLLRRNIQIHGIVTVTIDINKSGYILVKEIREDDLNVPGEPVRAFFKKMLERKLTTIRLQEPKDKNGKPAILNNWRITYKVGKFANQIILTKQ